jgi:hypothetical protein
MLANFPDAPRAADMLGPLDDDFPMMFAVDSLTHGSVTVKREFPVVPDVEQKRTVNALSLMQNPVVKREFPAMDVRTEPLFACSFGAILASHESAFVSASLLSPTLLPQSTNAVAVEAGAQSGHTAKSEDQQNTPTSEPFAGASAVGASERCQTGRERAAADNVLTSVELTERRPNRAEHRGHSETSRQNTRQLNGKCAVEHRRLYIGPSPTQRKRLPKHPLARGLSGMSFPDVALQGNRVFVCF